MDVMCPKSYSMMSASFGLLSIRHILCVSASLQDPPFIKPSTDELTKILLHHKEAIRRRSNDLSIQVVKSIGVDATVNVKGYSYLSSHNVVVGGAHPINGYQLGATIKMESKLLLILVGKVR